MTRPWNGQPALRRDCTRIYLTVEGLGRRPLLWILGHEIVPACSIDGSEGAFDSQGETPVVLHRAPSARIPPVRLVCLGLSGHDRPGSGRHDGPLLPRETE